MSAVAALARMTGTGIVGVHHVRNRQANGQYFSLFLMELIQCAGESMTQLSTGDVHAQIVEGLQQEGVGDMLRMMLV